MVEVLRHIGRTINTDRRIVVVYMQIPGREDHALVIDTDALPQAYHDELMDIVQGEGQKSPVLADILSRRIMNQTGVDILSTLHQAGRLTPMPVGQILMLPQPNRPVALTELLKFMGKQPEVKEVTETVISENRIVENQNIDKNDQKYQIAANIIAEAVMLEDEAKRKRDTAYAMYPALRPVAPVARAPIDTKIEQVSAPIEAVKPKRIRKPVAKKPA